MRRYLASLVTAGLLIGLLAGCAGEPTAPKADAPKAATTVELKAPGEQFTRSQASPAAESAAQPAAQPAAPTPSPAAGLKVEAPAPPPERIEPKGRMIYAWSTSLSPAWLDPQENGLVITPYMTQYAIHDAVVKHMPDKLMTPSLAESYEIAPDYKSATFTLRQGIKFHDGSPITAEDVKFTYENYRGANAKALKDRTERIDTPDDRTIRFVFKEPFLDFLVIYGTPASGAGWVIPKKHYEQVGPDGFKQHPIGAGPYKFVRQTAGTEVELEAFTDYWRKTPSVKTLIIKAAPEEATRFAQVQTGEADFAAQVQGPLIDVVRNDPNLRMTTRLGAPFWLEMPGFEKPDNPFNKLQVRQAVSYALDRQALSDAEQAGLARPLGNWLPLGWPGTIELPVLPHDLDRARQLMAEAGYPDGFEVPELTPLPPYFPFGERIITQLRAIGIRTKLQQMERGAFDQKITQGPGAFNGLILNVSAASGDAAARIRAYATCGGSSSRTCVPEIDEKFQRYEASTDPQERERLLNEIQTYMYENLIFIPVYRQAYLNVVGPRIANPWEEIFGAIPQYSFLGPYEDVRLKE